MRSTKRNVPMSLACLLLILVMFTTYLTSGLYARYIATGTGDDSARVIKFLELSIKENKGPFVITPGVPIVKDVEVSFDGSEAITCIFVEIDASDYWNSINGMTFTTKDGHVSFDVDSSNWTFVKKNGNKYAYYYSGVNTENGVLLPNMSVSNINVLTDDSVKNDGVGIITVSRYLKMSEFDQLAGLSLKFTATAVQANGFESINDAWAAVEAKGL